jgi:hypothetical protein
MPSISRLRPCYEDACVPMSRDSRRGELPPEKRGIDDVSWLMLCHGLSHCSTDVSKFIAGAIIHGYCFEYEVLFWTSVSDEFIDLQICSVPMCIQISRVSVHCTATRVPAEDFLQFILPWYAQRGGFALRAYWHANYGYTVDLGYLIT